MSHPKKNNARDPAGRENGPTGREDGQRENIKHISRGKFLLITCVLGACLGIAAVMVPCGGTLFSGVSGANDAEARADTTSQLSLDDIKQRSGFDGARAYDYLRRLCQIGPRRSGSEGMIAQRKLICDHFTKLDATVSLQKFGYHHPLNNSVVPMANIIVQWHPQRKERILLCTHYDTLPFPLLDPKDPRGPFVGANDGGSGVAVLMELGKRMQDLPCRYGVDFVFFDAEEFLFKPNGRFFVGSEWFAREYRQTPPPYRYRWGVLLDMIGDADLRIPQEQYSLGWRDTRPLVHDIWSTARRLGVREFVFKRGQSVRDDHLPLHNIAKIPTCDIIDFDYPPWHTQGDKLDKCSALSLAKVGFVIEEWLKTVK